MTKSLFSLFMLFAFLFTSCEITENAKKASENSGKAADNSTLLHGEATKARIMSRAGGAKDARGKALERMIERDTIEGKVIEAATYMKAFEYQIWTGQLYDDEIYLESLMEDAMNELYRNLKELNNGKLISDTNPTAFRINPWRKKRDANILAFALGMHKVHGLQIVADLLIKDDNGMTLDLKDDSKGVSPLDLIKEALVKIDKYENGKMAYGELKKHEIVIYENIDVFTALLNTRYNMILTLAIAELSNVDESSLKALTALLVPRIFKKINSHYMDLNDSQKNKANKYLDEAYKLSSFMNRYGAESFMYKDVQKIFKKMVHPSNESEDVLMMTVRDRKKVSEHYNVLEKLFEMNGNRVQKVK